MKSLTVRNAGIPALVVMLLLPTAWAMGEPPATAPAPARASVRDWAPQARAVEEQIAKRFQGGGRPTRLLSGNVVGPGRRVFTASDSRVVLRSLLNGGFAEVNANGSRTFGDREMWIVVSVAGDGCWCDEPPVPPEEVADFVATLAVKDGPEVAARMFAKGHGDWLIEDDADAPRWYLGLSLYSATGTHPRYIVRAVAAGSPAAVAGVRVGDVLRAVAGQDVRPRNGRKALAQWRIGVLDETLAGVNPDPVRLQLQRDEATLEFDIVPVERPAQNERVVSNQIGVGRYCIVYVTY